MGKSFFDIFPLVSTWVALTMMGNLDTAYPSYLVILV